MLPAPGRSTQNAKARELFLTLSSGQYHRLQPGIMRVELLRMANGHVLRLLVHVAVTIQYQFIYTVTKHILHLIMTMATIHLWPVLGQQNYVALGRWC